MRRLPLLGSFLLPLIGTLHAQEERWRVHSDTRIELVGFALAWLDDLDGDGLAEVAMTAHCEEPDDVDPLNPNETDRIEILRGADFTTLRILDGGFASRIGVGMAPTADRDGDGFGELAAIRLRDDGTAADVAIVSPASGATIVVLPIPGISSFRDAALEALPDSDGDGREELLVGFPFDDHGDGTFGTLRVIGGADGATLEEWRGASGFPYGEEVSWNLGSSRSFRRVPDADLDGIDDFVWVDWDTTQPGWNTFGVHLGSGATRSEIATREILKTDRFWLGGCTGVGDLDRDGRGDVVLAMNEVGTKNTVLELSGRNLATMSSIQLAEEPIHECASAGDLDGDGRGDWALRCASRDDIEEERTLLAVLGKKATIVLRFTRTVGTLFVPPSRAFARGNADDLDGDGVPELLIGEEAVPWYSCVASAVSTATDSAIRARESDRDWFLVHQLEFLGDVDGDGITDLVALASRNFAVWSTTVISGRDGGVLRQRPLDSVHWSGFTAPLASLPDVDGDGLADYAVFQSRLDPASGRWEWFVDARSGLDDADLWRTKIRDWRFSFYHPQLTVVRDDAGARTIVVFRDPDYRPSAMVEGLVMALDAVDGTPLWEVEGTAGEDFGSGLAALDDLDGDGVREVAIGIPGRSVAAGVWGAVEIRSGIDGSLQATIDPIAGTIRFGERLARSRDLDQDDVADLLVLNRLSKSPCDLEAWSVASRSRLWSASWPQILDPVLLPLPDSNGDGADEVLYGGGGGEAMTVVDDRDGRFLGRAFANESLHRGMRMSAPPEWLAADAYGPPARFVTLVDGPREGCAIVSFPELWLTIDPDVAPVGATATATVTGGVPASLVGLYLVAIDGLSFDQFLAFDVFDATGAWTTTESIPAGLEGTTWTLRAFSVGFDARLARSGFRDFAFE